MEMELQIIIIRFKGYALYRSPNQIHPRYQKYLTGSKITRRHCTNAVISFTNSYKLISMHASRNMYLENDNIIQESPQTNFIRRFKFSRLPLPGVHLG